MMYTLKNWYLEKLPTGNMLIWGTVYGHHRLKDDSFIHTSCVIKNYKLSENEYVMVTFSGSLYHLLTDEMDPEEELDTRELLLSSEISNDAEMEQTLSQAEIALAEKKRIVDDCEKTAKKNMDEDGLYLIMDHSRLVKAVLKRGSLFQEIEASIHVGMLMDSVLIVDWKLGNVDFRYYLTHPIKPYHWSDGLPNVYIHNINHRPVIFKGTKKDISCAGNAVTKIAHTEFTGEGLLSPDAVSGKCMFHHPTSETNSFDQETQPSHNLS